MNRKTLAATLLFGLFAPFAAAQATAVISLQLPPTGVTPGTYTCPIQVVDAYGRVTSISNGSCGTAAVNPNLYDPSKATAAALKPDGTLDTSYSPYFVVTDFLPVTSQPTIIANQVIGWRGGTTGGSCVAFYASDKATLIATPTTGQIAANTTIAVPSGAIWARVMFDLTNGSPVYNGSTTGVYAGLSTVPTPFVAYGTAGAAASSAAVSPAFGKKLAFFGDSYFSGYNASGGASITPTIPQAVATLLGATLVFNDSVPGRNTANALNNYTAAGSLATALAGVDYVGLEMSGNDIQESGAANPSVYGAYTDAAGASTWAGALRTLFAAVAAAAPTAHIVLITPINAFPSGTIDYNANGMFTLGNAIVADYGGTAIDLRRAGINGANASTTLQSDGHHPSAIGRDTFLAPYVAAQLGLVFGHS